jgi:DNA polymerase-1
MVILKTDCEISSGTPTGQICDSHWCFETGKERRAKINELNALSKQQFCEVHGLKEPPPIPKMDFGPINLGSSEQLIAAYEKLGVHLTSTRGEYLETVDHPTITPLIGWKKTEKLVTAFGDKIIEAASFDGRVHPSINLVVNTGRGSCSNPNEQQCPPGLRHAHIAPDGCAFFILDFSQMELREIAELSGDKAMRQVFINGLDIHLDTAARMLGGIPYKEAAELLKLAKADAEIHGDAWTLEHHPIFQARQDAKPVNYGVAYGKADKETIRIFSKAYPRAWQWLQQTGRLGWEDGFTRSFSGLKRRYPHDPPKDWEGSIWSWKSAVERRAKNHPVQGGCADIYYLAVVAVWEELVRPGKAQLWMMVHDEMDGYAEGDPDDKSSLVHQVGARAKELAIEAAKRYMTDVPVDVDLHITKRWDK